MRDVSTNATTETVDVSTTSDASSIETQNESASSLTVYVDSVIQGEKKVVYKTFDETVRKLPYDEKNDIIMFDRNMKEPKFSSNMVSLNNAPKTGG